MHQLALECSEYGRSLKSDLDVTQPTLEKQGKHVNRRTLSELAQLTGGAHGTVDQIEEIIAKISALPEPEPYEQRYRVWAHPAWMGTLIFLLAVYWTGRKFAGLV